MIIASVVFWRWWAKHRTEPSAITKMTMSALILSLAPLVPAAGSYIVLSTGHRIGLGWAALFEVINDIGYANFIPVGLALYSRVAPKSLGGMMTGIYYTHLFAANMLAGWLGSFMQRMSGTNFWLLHAGVVFSAAIVLMLVRDAVRRLLVPTFDTIK
jgi:proton-dependent oligopeptide transporter, POT family